MTQEFISSWNRGLGEHNRLLKLDTLLGQDVLLPQRLVAEDRLGRGYEYTVDALSLDRNIALKQLIAQLLILQFRQDVDCKQLNDRTVRHMKMMRLAGRTRVNVLDARETLRIDDAYHAPLLFENQLPLRVMLDALSDDLDWRAQLRIPTTLLQEIERLEIVGARKANPIIAGLQEVQCNTGVGQHLRVIAHELVARK